MRTPAGSLGALQVATFDGPYNNDTIAYSSYDVLGRVATRQVDTMTERFGFDTLDRLNRNVNAS